MKWILIKTAIVIAVLVIVLIHMTSMRGYFSIGGEILVPLAVAVMLFGVRVKED